MFFLYSSLNIRGRRKGGSLHKWHWGYISLKFSLANISYYDANWRICYQILGFPTLYKLKKWRRPLPVPVIHICWTYINTCWTKPNDVGLFDRPVTFRMRVRYVAGSRCHLFVYYAMRHILCSPLCNIMIRKNKIRSQCIYGPINCTFFYSYYTVSFFLAPP